MSILKFKCKGKELLADRDTFLCGIINVTPDSFSDGGNYFSCKTALQRAKQLADNGANILDIGGESTRPGSTPVSEREEIERIVPVIKAIKKEMDVLVSVDTWKACVAEAAIEAGADIINDITGLLGDAKMIQVLAKLDVGAVLMFNPVILRPEHEASKKFPIFGKNELISDRELQEMNVLPIDKMMFAYFHKISELLKEYNIEKERIMLDPGIGFGMSKKENLTLIQSVKEINQLGFFSFLGVSRKRFIVNILQENGIFADIKSKEGLENVDYASSFLTAITAYMGVNVLRVHDVQKHFAAKVIADSVRLSESASDTYFQAYGKDN